MSTFDWMDTKDLEATARGSELEKKYGRGFSYDWLKFLTDRDKNLNYIMDIIYCKGLGDGETIGRRHAGFKVVK